MTTLIICSECHKHNKHILANYKMKDKPYYTLCEQHYRLMLTHFPVLLEEMEKFRFTEETYEIKEG